MEIKFSFLFSLIACFSLNVLSQNVPIQSYEGYYLKQPDYPIAATHDWHPDHTEVQGVTNDGYNWYFTITANSGADAFLWKVPVSIPLSSNIASLQEIEVVSMSQIIQLQSENYQHWGDPDHFQYRGIDYIFIPITGSSDPIIACFRADNLSFINYAILNTSQQSDVGWCAVGIDGDIYTSGDNTNKIIHYTVNWNLLLNSNNRNALSWVDNYPLTNSNGEPYMLYNMQGGEFTPSGELLYISSGNGECLGFGYGVFPSDGIHVFETVNWQEIKRSTNSAMGGGRNYFDYTFNNECACVTGSQTPEGLTIWDLDNDKAPNIRGQLHVVVNFFNEYALCEDEMSLQHFGRNIYIDRIKGFPPEWTNPLIGTKDRPFKSLNEAYHFYQIWDGAQMVIKGGAYNDTGIYSRRIRLTSSDGTVIIGKQ